MESILLMALPALLVHGRPPSDRNHHPKSDCTAWYFSVLTHKTRPDSLLLILTFFGRGLVIIVALLFNYNVKAIWGLGYVHMTFQRGQVWAKDLLALSHAHYFIEHQIFTCNLCSCVRSIKALCCWDSKGEIKSEIVISEPEGQHAAFALGLNSWISGKRLW